MPHDPAPHAPAADASAADASAGAATLSHHIVPVSPYAQNCTLVWDTQSRACAVIDPGFDAPRIRAALAARNLVPGAIWLTHGHLDHAGAAAELQALCDGIPILGPHAADRFLLDGIETQAGLAGLAGMHSCTPTRFLDEGDTLPLGPHTFQVRHVPGHTPGHIVFVCEKMRFAQVGDTLFAGSVGRTDFTYGDTRQLLHAIRTRLLTLPDDTRIVPGHGLLTSIGRERVSNPFFRPSTPAGA